MSVFRADRPLIFKDLRFLVLSKMVNLVKLLIQAPQLYVLDVENCSLLTDQMLDGVIEGKGHLQKLNVHGCPLIEEKEMRKLCP